IFGHDETEGQAAYSVRVSQRRAEAVQAYLISMGFDGGLISTEGRGQSDLAVETGPGVREPLNRRAVIDIRARLRAE
ncbi:MAG TPA: OmpA family protein, partial [Terricaulis sp.]|nr:OmpA family protein [Terricaulis sp.]